MARGAVAMAQVNIRMNSALKAQGDEVLALAEVSPSQLVRAVWAKVAQGRESLDQLVRVLAADVKPTDAAEGTPLGDAMVERIRRRQEGFELQFGLDSETYWPLTEDEMRDVLYEQRLERNRERLVGDV
ncbi:MAG: hypothetical protein IKG21_11190 [Atopobiaceae bacterium]|nr:hypothetical protein [Atopobiaceae bacterium]